MYYWQYLMFILVYVFLTCGIFGWTLTNPLYWIFVIIPTILLAWGVPKK